MLYKVNTFRYLVASRDLRAGEVIIEEPAIAVGPCSGCALICLGCYRELDETNFAKLVHNIIIPYVLSTVHRMRFKLS